MSEWRKRNTLACLKLLLLIALGGSKGEEIYTLFQGHLLPAEVRSDQIVSTQYKGQKPLASILSHDESAAVCSFCVLWPSLKPAQATCIVISVL